VINEDLDAVAARLANEQMPLKRPVALRRYQRMQAVAASRVAGAVQGTRTPPGIIGWW
jgi:hypothetical protein